MFAPKVAETKTKASESPSSRRALQPVALAAPPFGCSAVKPAPMLQGSIASQATPRLLAQQALRSASSKPGGDHEQTGAAEAMMAREAPRGASWDFSKIPLFPHDRASWPQVLSPLAAPPLPNGTQPKLAIGSVDDPLEHEADKIADHVLRMPEPDLCVTVGNPANKLAPQRSPFAARPLSSSSLSEPPLQGIFQTNLAVGKVNDLLEQEADRAADRVMSMEQGQTVFVPGRQASFAGSGELLAPPIVHDVLRSAGRPLDSETRGFLEPRFGFDFNTVRVHTGAKATESARAIQAHAYTAGHHVVFGAGRSGADGRLLAHELAHVVQQAGRGGFSTIRRQAAAAETEEYIPKTGAPEHQPKNDDKDKLEVLGRLDVDDLFQKHPAVSQRVLAIAEELRLDPGLLAESLYAETTKEWMRTTGKIESERLGMDDWFDASLEKRLKDIIDAHPALGLRFEDVKKTGKMWNPGQEKDKDKVILKPRGKLDADKAVQAWAVYVKAEVDFLRDLLSKEPSLKNSRIKNLDDLTPEQRLAIERVATNAGVGIAKKDFMILSSGGDIPREGSVRRDKDHPLRTATLHMGRAVHLDQTVFGRPASDYKPAPSPARNEGPLVEQSEDPQLKKLPPWITPIY